MVSDDLKTRCLKLTSRFEGGWSAVAGNFDGQGLSFGPLQWNLGQGTLQPLLAHLARLGPELALCCGTDFARMCLDGTIEQHVRKVVLQPDGSVFPEWKNRLERLSLTAAANQAFLQAADPYFRKAGKACLLLGFETERAYALCFDIAVQNGGPRPQHLERYFRDLPPLHQEWEKLKRLARVVADCAHPRWQKDVLSRKMAIALGSTRTSGMRVHGQHVDLEQDHGIRYGAPWRGQPEVVSSESKPVKI